MAGELSALGVGLKADEVDGSPDGNLMDFQDLGCSAGCVRRRLDKMMIYTCRRLREVRLLWQWFQLLT